MPRKIKSDNIAARLLERYDSQSRCTIVGCTCPFNEQAISRRTFVRVKGKDKREVSYFEGSIECPDLQTSGRGICKGEKVDKSQWRQARIVDKLHEVGTFYSVADAARLTEMKEYWTSITLKSMIASGIVSHNFGANEYKLVGCVLAPNVEYMHAPAKTKEEKEYIGQWARNSHMGMVLYELRKKGTDGATVKYLMRRTGLLEHQVRRALQRLVDSGAVEHDEALRVWRVVSYE